MKPNIVNKYQILRPCVYFTTGQVIAKTKMLQYFTEEGLKELENRGYAKQLS
jgi:hypothetical protein